MTILVEPPNPAAIMEAISDGACEAIGGMALGSATLAIAEGTREAIGGIPADAVCRAIADGVSRAVTAYLDVHVLRIATTKEN